MFLYYPQIVVLIVEYTPLGIPHYLCLIIAIDVTRCYHRRVMRCYHHCVTMLLSHGMSSRWSMSDSMTMSMNHDMSSR